MNILMLSMQIYTALKRRPYDNIVGRFKIYKRAYMALFRIYEDEQINPKRLARLRNTICSYGLGVNFIKNFGCHGSIEQNLKTVEIDVERHFDICREYYRHKPLRRRNSI